MAVRYSYSLCPWDVRKYVLKNDIPDVGNRISGETYEKKLLAEDQDDGHKEPVKAGSSLQPAFRHST
ncbi:hypothetical protein ACFL4C_03475 [Candidatus Omnitrophota bacterium]